MHTSETSFISGLDLSECFYNEVVQPILREHFPELRHTAALIGSGSEVLGFDTEMSADHHWGPRVMLFLKQGDLANYKAGVGQTLSEKLPRKFRGYPTSYTRPNLQTKGVQLLDHSEEGPINHRIEMMSIRDFINEYLGFDINQQITPVDWLTFPEHKLRSITAGRVFHDEVGLEGVRKRFAYYPHDVWLYLLASSWTRIEQEEHLMGRAGFVGDEIGSSIIGSRLVRDLMRLCFQMEKCYAPYAKWFGTAFRSLAAGKILEPIFERVLSARDWKARQLYLSQAYENVANLHNQLNITELLPNTVSQFHDRPFLVLSMGAFSKAIAAQITDPVVSEIAKKPLIGGVDQFSDSTDILSDAVWRTALRGLYPTM
jgi:hypothetical protein